MCGCQVGVPKQKRTAFDWYKSTAPSLSSRSLWKALSATISAGLHFKSKSPEPNHCHPQPVIRSPRVSSCPPKSALKRSGRRKSCNSHCSTSSSSSSIAFRGYSTSFADDLANKSDEASTEEVALEEISLTIMSEESECYPVSLVSSALHRKVRFCVTAPSSSPIPVRNPDEEPAWSDFM
ncbi:hypothetical protein C8R43DRAFT_1039362, partial [Mycena crocata]